jgi:hypothetical protein
MNDLFNALLIIFGLVVAGFIYLIIADHFDK